MAASDVAKSFRRIWPSARRFLVLFGVVAVLWSAIGSSIFPDWFYELFWQRGFSSSDFWETGIDYWLANPILPITVAVLGIVAAVLIRRYRTTFWPLIDRLGNRLILGCAIGILATAAVVYGYGRWSYGALRQIVALNATIRQLQTSLPSSPVIQAPVDFEYIDKERVQGLYNQIEPELVEAQRSVGTGRSLSGKVGIEAGPVETELGASKRQESTSTYQHLNFSPERQCVEVMNFLLQGHQANYYTSDRQWISQKAASNFQLQLMLIQKGSTKFRPLPLEQPVGAETLTKDEREAAEGQLKQYEDALNAELTSLQGMVIIDGTFAASNSLQGNPVLVEAFADMPRRLVFRVAAPSTLELSRILSLGKTHLRVFGTVLRPLSENGVIEVRPIAIS